jgi:hypothetical protein
VTDEAAGTIWLGRLRDVTLFLFSTHGVFIGKIYKAI